tara:strand:+ start:529 stop:921 length:393 start_codon:yes stop_codon:yes gene_type:complete
MKRIALIMVTVSGLAAAPLAAVAQSDTAKTGPTEAQMFLKAKVSLQKATDIALKEIPGTLSGIGFNDENGKGLYEAHIVAADGQSSTIKIDADTGAVLSKGLASLMDDEENDSAAGNEQDGENGKDHDRG